jgi:quinol monooxygenase YgiN
MAHLYPRYLQIAEGTLMRIFRWAFPLITLGWLAIAPVHAQSSDLREIVVVTHVDINPVNGEPPPEAVQLLEQFVLDSRKDPGVQFFTLISQTGTTNHFQLIEVFQDFQSLDAHVSAAHTVAFRNGLQPFLGAPYDERLCHPF